MNAARRPTAYAVGYFLAPLRGSSSPHIFRLTLMGQRPGLRPRHPRSLGARPAKAK